MSEIVSEEQLNPNYVIDVTKPSHLAWWAAAFAVPEQAVIEAVDVVGPQATQVLRYLQQDCAHSTHGSEPDYSADRRRSDRREADRRVTEFPDEAMAVGAQHGSDQR